MICVTLPRRLGGSTKSASPPRATIWNGWRTTYRHHSTEEGTHMNLVSQTTKRIRWTIGINGALSVAFGAMILAWPGISLYALTILFGAYALTCGVVGLVNTSRVKEGRGWTALSSVLGIGVGLAVLAWPSISALGLLYVIATYAIALGVIAIVGAFWLPLAAGDAVLLSL